MGRGQTKKTHPFKPDEVATPERLRDDKGRWLPGQPDKSWRYPDALKRKQPHPEDLEQITRLVAAGHGLHSLCTKLGINGKVWQRWKKEFPEVREAYERGLGQEEFEIVSELKRIMKAKDNPIPGMFVLKCRHGWVEGAPAQSDNRVAISVTMPAALSPDQYKPEILVQKPKAIQGADDDDG